MRKISLICCALLSVAVLACNKTEDPNTKPEKPTPEKPEPEPEPKPEPEPQNSAIIVVGQEYLSDKEFYDAVMWVDGKRFAFTKGEHDSFCNAVYTYKDSVFIAATEAVGELVSDEYYGDYNENNGVVYSFKIGEEDKFKRTVYGGVKGKSTASGVAYSNGNIYVSGFDSPGFDRRALYWKNEQKFELTDGSVDALAYCVAADGDDVYVGDGVLAKVNKIVIEDGHVYAAGAYRDAVNGGNWQGAIWIDGKMTLFTEKVGIEVGGLYVKDGNWIVNGNMTLEDGTISAYNWYSDGSVEALTPGAALCQGLGVTKLGDDVYSLTCAYSMNMSTYEDIYKGSLLKNKEKVEMEVHSPDNFTFWDLTVARY